MKIDMFQEKKHKLKTFFGGYKEVSTHIFIAFVYKAYLR